MSLPAVNANMIHFMISYIVAFIAFALIAIWYVWPNIRNRPPKAALSPLLLYSCLRINGLMFLMPGVVSPDLPSAFAVPTAYGDATAVLLALIALLLLRTESVLALPAIWLFNVEGTLDLVYANFATFKYHVDPAQLGASYYLATVNVPAELLVHVLIFACLFRVPPDEKMHPA
ncbi:MAG TPA: hypothetical protein VKV77_09530 [Methylovirgula sp.]|nr:hypothetical protein [Methylovirgula sp.]